MYLKTFRSPRKVDPTGSQCDPDVELRGQAREKFCCYKIRKNDIFPRKTREYQSWKWKIYDHLQDGRVIISVDWSTVAI